MACQILADFTNWAPQLAGLFLYQGNFDFSCRCVWVDCRGGQLGLFGFCTVLVSWWQCACLPMQVYPPSISYALEHLVVGWYLPLFFSIGCCAVNIGLVGWFTMLRLKADTHFAWLGSSFSDRVYKWSVFVFSDMIVLLGILCRLW